MRVSPATLVAGLMVVSGCVCGGPAAPCPDGSCDRPKGAACAAGFECASGRCTAGECEAGTTPVGAACTAGGACASGSCADGKCVEATASAGGCRQLDLVISVDNSSSMKEEKSSMRGVVFPAFAQALKKLPGVTDFRVGVLDACPSPAAFHTRGVGGDCRFEGGKRWMDSRSTRLAEEFSCVGDIDSAGSTCTGKNDDEQPASSSAAALEAPAGNAGFLRDSAVLVVVAITDEDEQPTPDRAAEEVYRRLVAVKGGDPKRMVFLGIGGRQSCSGAYGSAKEAVKLKAVSELFSTRGHGLFWDLCVGHLEDGLSQAVQKVADACSDFPETGGAGRPCTSDGQCGSGTCTNGVCEGGPGAKPDGSPCTAAQECASAVCVDGKCAGIN